MKPLVKWAGGKTRLLPVIRDIIGSQPIRNYYEPCAGGAALFFDIWERIRGQCYLNDINPALIDMYRGVAIDPQGVVDALQALRSVPYEQLKERFNYQDPKTPVTLKAARFLALNHCCFNGLWRVNKSGEFNVPVGRNSKGRTNSLDTFEWLDVIHAAMALKNVTLTHDALWMWSQVYWPGPGDLVFFDPPYLSTFNSYSADGFNIANHEDLRDTAKSFGSQGARVIVCASDTDLTREVYGEPAIVVTLERTIGASKRGATSEVLYLY